jgi:lipopolysaccharide/colanic/teichoic acid biosynthesis glycosyltransferase
MKFNNSRKYQHNYTNYILDSDNGFYIEDYFREVLTLERRRSERSRKKFILMLLDIHRLLGDNGDSNIIKKLSHVLTSTTREIDIKGWYEHNSVIGIIFTEINGVDKESIVEKVNSSLLGNLNPDQAKLIEIDCYSFPEEHKDRDPGSSGPDLELYPDLSKRKSSKKGYLFLKRLMDIAGSIIGILILSPLFIIIPALIKLTSRGPVFFKQERLGMFGEKFIFFKFRSMYLNCDDEIHKKYVKELIKSKGGNGGDGQGASNKCYKITNDPRVTMLGMFLRKSSLDEIPQFINVLNGDMSLVGPRPPIPYELDNYDVWHKRRVLEVKPGITGIWQVEGRSSTTFDEMVRMDIRYVRTRSMMLDLKLLFKTPWVVLTSKGAY